MKRYSDDIETKLSCGLQQPGTAGKRCAELETETAERFAIIGKDTKNKLGVGMGTLGLVQLIGIIESHHVDSLLGSSTDERSRLAWVGEDNPIRRRVGWQRQHLSDLGGRSTVKGGTEKGEEVKDRRSGVALDSVKDLDTRTDRRGTPCLYGLVDSGQIGGEESGVIAGAGKVGDGFLGDDFLYQLMHWCVADRYKRR